MSEFKPILVYSDYFSNGMTDEEFIKLFLEAKQGKTKSLEDVVDLDKFYQQFDEEEAKEKIYKFISQLMIKKMEENMNNNNFEYVIDNYRCYIESRLDKNTVNSYCCRIRELYKNNLLNIKNYKDIFLLNDLRLRFLRKDLKQENQKKHNQYSASLSKFIDFINSFNLDPSLPIEEAIKRILMKEALVSEEREEISDAEFNQLVDSQDFEKMLKDPHGLNSKINVTIFGHDDDQNHVKYMDGIDDSQKVPGLARYLENEYESIMAFIRDEILADFDNEYDIDRIPVYLSTELPQDSYKLDGHFIAHLIKTKEDITEDEIYELIEGKEETLPRIGYFLPYHDYHDKEDNPYIKIYYLNFGKKYPIGSAKYFAVMSQCLAHEYNHYVQYIMNKELFCSPGKMNDIVKEAMAEFSANLYLLYRVKYRYDEQHQGIAEYKRIAKDRYDWWKDYDGCGIPYAYAFKFFHVLKNWVPYSDNYDDYLNNGSFGKFVEFIRSYRNAELERQVYNLLLE